jgi:hypothetical protein
MIFLLHYHNIVATFVAVKLKRNIAYKSYVSFQKVTPANIQQALSYLKKNNKFYQDIHLNEDWESAVHKSSYSHLLHATQTNSSASEPDENAVPETNVIDINH